MVSNDVKDKVIKLRKEGKTYGEIHTITSVSKSSISDICRPLKLGGNKTIVLTDELIEKAQELYDEIGNIKKVSKILNIGYERLSKFVKLKEPHKVVTDSDAVSSWRKRVKAKLIEYKGGKCEICGYNRCPEALEFHHKDPNEKEFSISGKSKSYETLKQEVDKCLMVCANCHREIHSGLINLRDILKDNKLEDE